MERGQLHPVLDAASDTGAYPRSADRNPVQHVDDEYDADRDGLDGDLTDLRSLRWVCAVTPQISVRRQYRHRHLHHLSGAADTVVHSARRHHQKLPSRRLALGPDPDLPDLPHSVLHLADDGLLQIHTEGIGGMRPHRWGAALESDGLYYLPDC